MDNNNRWVLFFFLLSMQLEILLKPIWRKFTHFCHHAVYIYIICDCYLQQLDNEINKRQSWSWSYGIIFIIFIFHFGLELGLWCKRRFQQYFSLYRGGQFYWWSTMRKPPTCLMSLAKTALWYEYLICTYECSMV
jgi:hypothetical protein